jgi:hypothetical protein
MTALDPRLYILGGLLLLAAVLFLYLLGALLRHRSVVRMAKRAATAATPFRPTNPVAELTAPEDVLGAPLRTGDWRPDAPPLAATQTALTEDRPSGGSPLPKSIDVPAAVIHVEATELVRDDGVPVAELRLAVPARQVVIHAPVDSAPVDPVPVTEAPPTSSAASTPGLAAGSVLSSASSMARSGVRPGAPPEELPTAPTVDAAEVSDDASEYVLVAPVELHFTLGEGRVGVRVGSRTFAEFQRLAEVLLGELRSSGGRRPS